MIVHLPQPDLFALPHPVPQHSTHSTIRNLHRIVARRKISILDVETSGTEQRSKEISVESADTVSEAEWEAWKQQVFADLRETGPERVKQIFR